MTKIKICGLTRPEDIAAVNLVLPEYVGFVFAPSRRRIDPATAALLKSLLDPRITAVGVFVNAPIHEIAALADVLDVIQLHGSEDEAYLRTLHGAVPPPGKPLVKAVSVTRAGDVQRAAETVADYLLLDRPGGGTGQTFDWQRIGATDKPFFLAGGLTPHNVGEAVRQVRPFAVDVSSGVETDGRKDADQIMRFVDAVRYAK